jgi:hypothetical protein
MNGMKKTILLAAVAIALLTASTSSAYPGARCMSSAGCWTGEVCIVTQPGQVGVCAKIK